jgi:hypothetical protein
VDFVLDWFRGSTLRLRAQAIAGPCTLRGHRNRGAQKITDNPVDKNLKRHPKEFNDCSKMRSMHGGLSPGGHLPIEMRIVGEAQ